MEFTLKTKINASARDIYNSWLSSQGHTKMTGGNANVTDKVGDSFDAWDGYISGKNLTLNPYSRIVQSWRTSQFKDNEPDSRIELILEDSEGGTILTLLHTNIPDDGEHYRKGWDEHYFRPMKSYFLNKT